jgi:hypothetical protein
VAALLTDRPHGLVQVAHRPLADYDALTGLTVSDLTASDQDPTQAPTLQQPTQAMVGAA